METTHKRSHCDDVAKIRWLHQFFRGKLLTSITRDQLIAIAERKRSERVDGKPLHGAGARHPAAGQGRTGVDRQGAQGQDVPGGEAPRAMDYARTGPGIDGGAHAPPAGPDLVRAGHPAF
jgi:hypothetical protein